MSKGNLRITPATVTAFATSFLATDYFLYRQKFKYVNSLVWATANNAIITSMTEEGYWDVSLNITHIDLMPGLETWDDLAFATLQQESWFSDYNGSIGMDMWEKIAVLDIASGTMCQDMDGCMDDIASHYQSLCDAAS